MGALQTADEIESLIYQVVVSTTETAIKAEVPFLALPGVSQLFNLIFEYLAGKMYVVLENYVAFTIIDFETAHENSQYQAAVNQLAQALAKGDPNGLSEARDQFKSSLSSLIHFDT